MDVAHKRHLLVFGGYVLLALFMTLPVAVTFGDHVAGLGGDPWQTMWRFEEKWGLLQEALGSGEAADAISFAQEEFFGGGQPRLVNLSVWPWMWLQPLFGQPTGYNLVWLLSFVLSGYGMYLFASWLFTRAGSVEDLARPVLIREAPAFLAGVAYMFVPYHVAQAQGHFGALQLQWLPLIMVTAGATVVRPAVWKMLALTGLLIIQAWSEHHYMLWLGLFALLAGVFFTDEIRRFWQGRWGPLYVVLLLTLLLLFVVVPYWPTARLAAGSEATLQLGQEQTIRFSADPFAYIVPASFHPIWGGLAYVLFNQYFTGNEAEATHFLGLLPLLLVLFFNHSIPSRQKLFWLAAAASFAIISFGPRLHVLGRVTPLVLPYALLDQLPIFDSVRAVARSSALVALSWMVLFAWVLRYQLRRWAPVVLLFGLLLVEFLFVPTSVQPTALSAVYDVLAREPGTAVIEIPAATNYTAASRALYASRVHHKSVIGNFALERAGEGEFLAEARSLPVLRQLLYLRTTHLLEDRLEFFGQSAVDTFPDTLRWLDAQAIVIHQDSVSALQLRAIEHLLERTMGLVGQQVEDTVLYRIPSELAGDGVFLARDERWQAVGYDRDRDAHFAEVSDAAAVVLYNVTPTVRRVRLSFGIPEESEGSLLLRQGDQILFEGVSPEHDRVTATVDLEPGATTLEFVNRLPGRIILQDPRLDIL